MAKITIVCGLLLIGLGVIGYVGSGGGSSADTAAESSSPSESADTSAEVSPGKKSITALIPAFVGLALAACGVLALKESMLKHAMHAAAMVGLLGTLAGAGRGVMGLGKSFSGDPSLNQRSFLYVWLMAVICGVFVFLCVRSFISVRRQRAAEQAEQAA